MALRPIGNMPLKETEVFLTGLWFSSKNAKSGIMIQGRRISRTANATQRNPVSNKQIDR